MSVLDRIFKKNSAAVALADKDGLMDAFTIFLNAKTHAEERKVLEQYPGLLDAAHESLLRTFIEAAGQSEHPETKPYFQAKYDILQSCRKNGIAKTFASKTDFWTGGPSPYDMDIKAEFSHGGETDFSSLLAEFVQTKTWDEVRHFLEQHPGLYSEKMMPVYDLMLKKDTGMRNLLILQHAALLRRCRQKGVARTIQDEIDVFGPNKPVPAMKLLAVCTSRQRATIRKMLELSPELLIGDLDEASKPLNTAIELLPDFSEGYTKGIELVKDCRLFDDIEKGLALFARQNPGYLS